MEGHGELLKKRGWRHSEWLAPLRAISLAGLDSHVA